ncbi:MAG: putative lipid II flippase FtsW [Spirochaeta sp.]|jgi:cell division protein FtsW|nr:putative lipid II flippase FtsW [Spirochaeta sp.]
MGRRGFFVEQIEQGTRRIDAMLVAILFMIIVVGLGMLWSASWFRAEQLYGDSTRFVLRQSLWVLVGLITMGVAILVPLEFVRKALPAIVLFTAIISLLTFVPGVSARYMGARRWIVLFNVSFQPSELIKLTLIVYLAHIFSRSDRDFSDPLKSLLPPLVVVLFFAGIVLFQNDFSTAVFLLLMALAIFFTAGVPISYFARMFAVIVPLTLMLVFTREHRVRRIIAFLNPTHDPSGGGFQILAARRALESGGLWGVGIGESSRKLGGLPEAQSDFLFAVLGEELGFAGVLLVICLFGAFAARGIYLANRQNDPFRSLLVFGVTASITLQALLNIAVVVGAVPATGIPLPFFSSGGSSLLVSFAMCGVMLNAAGPAPTRARPRNFYTVGNPGWEARRV